MLVLEEKPLQGKWWKFGAGLAALQITLWLMLGFKYNPDLDVVWVFATSYVVAGAFVLAAFLPFLAGRFGMNLLLWFGIVGFVIADLAYFALALFPPTRQVNLLPFSAFIQFYSTAAIIGVFLEFGRYVYKKVKE